MLKLGENHPAIKAMIPETGIIVKECYPDGTLYDHGVGYKSADGTVEWATDCTTRLTPNTPYIEVEV